jgi:hypothetical protein
MVDGDWFKVRAFGCRRACPARSVLVQLVCCGDQVDSELAVPCARGATGERNQRETLDGLGRLQSGIGFDEVPEF